jgi:predicted MFS family arabinose efflux permease
MTLLRLSFLLIACTTGLGIAGTDLVLPAIPSLPAALGGDIVRAQYVLASYAAGTGLGLILFGELGARFDQRSVLISSLCLFAACSLAAAFVRDIDMLIALRLVQGALGAAAPALAPGLVRALYPPDQAIGALGIIASIESLVPALAPAAGYWLILQSDWRASFWALGLVGAVLTFALLAYVRHLPKVRVSPSRLTYASLWFNRRYLRYALSQACSLGALLIFVFGAPAVITGPMGGKLADFITMQISGIMCFIISANLVGRLVTRFGHEQVIWAGSGLMAVSGLLIVIFALSDATEMTMLTVLFVPMNLGLGLRGPPGFFQALVSAGDNDARGGALVIVMVLALVALGTALVAPWIMIGLLPLALTSFAAACLSLFILYALSGKNHNNGNRPIKAQS